MADLIQSIADGLFNFFLIFENFLDILDNILFLDSGYSLLVLFYAISLILFIVRLFTDFIVGDQNDDKDTVTFTYFNDEDDIFSEDVM